MAARKCDICGADLPANLMQGLCPKCLLKHSMTEDDPSDAPDPSGAPPLAPDAPHPPAAGPAATESLPEPTAPPGPASPGRPAPQRRGQRRQLEEL